MATEDLRSFTIQGVVGGLLLTMMLGFAINFMFWNNPSGLDDGTGEIIGAVYTNNSGYLIESDVDADTLLNITANTNPEASDLGSRDSVATSYSATGTGKSSWEKSIALIKWVFTGTAGQILIGVLSALIGLISWFAIVKLIRQGS